MKKIIALLLLTLLLCASLPSCGGEASADGEKLNIVTTSHVVKEWISAVADGVEAVDVRLLADEGKDMHNFQPSAADIRDIKRADIAVYIGGESDKWIEPSLNGAECASVKLIECIPHAHTAECEGDGHHHDEEGADEHIWLSIKNPAVCVEKICEALCAKDPENSLAYTANKNAYNEKLTSVAMEYEKAVSAAEHSAVVFADRFPFVYLVNELGLEYYAAFPGCSSETTASFETIVNLASKVDMYKLPCVLVISDSSDTIAATVIENTVDKSARVVTLDSMQVYKGDFSGYIETMLANLEMLKVALGVNE
jgi:zinc transport system substrate-binding protein